jgi:hypothetical protein
MDLDIPDFLNMDMFSSDIIEDNTEYKSFKVVKQYDVNSYHYFRLLYNNVVRQLRETVPLIINDNIGDYMLPPPMLQGGRYCHYEYSTECSPDSDRCESGCFRYWCGACGFGCCGMYSYCMNYNCFSYIKDCHPFVFENINDNNRMNIYLIVNNIRLSDNQEDDYRRSLDSSCILLEY